MDNYQNISPEEWERIEAEEHDAHYAKSLPFGAADFKIDVDRVLWFEDYCYKKGRRKDRGHRTKRVFELMDLAQLAGKTILDVGCGNGQYSVFFAMLGARVSGIDITPVGVEMGRKTAAANGVADRCRFSVQNAAKLDFADGEFDIVLLHEVLHHTVKYPGVKAEILRVMKPGGLLVCAEGLYGNPLVQMGRNVTMRGEEAKGDVVINLGDLEGFAEGFSSHRIELMSLLFMGKRVFQSKLGFAPVRWFLYLVKKTDDVLLAVFPFLRKYCGEAVLVAWK